MYKLIRIFNQNRRQILIAILAIVFVLGTIKILDIFYKKQEEEKLQNILNASNQINTSTYNPSYSVITGNKINEEVNKKAAGVIQDFIKKCNESKVEEAYDLISTDCKNEVYPSIDDFKVYYRQNFNTKKDYTLQLWVSDSLTYKVELVEDVLSSGKIGNGVVLQDFFTIVKEDGKEKINISEYIRKVQINKTNTLKGITVKVNYKNIFKDYEIYNITIENKSKNDILLDSLESTKKMYLIGENDATYTASSYELNENAYSINKNYVTTLNIKFNKQYTTNVTVKALVFSDAILDKNEYENTKNKKEYTNRMKIQVEL